jgi:branched-chain amino acid transport system substrate-binding protein
MKNIKLVLFFFSMILPLVLIRTVIAAGIDQRPITIGVLENRNYSYADMMRKSFELALRSINRQGGINGRMLALAYADDGGDKRTGVQMVEHLVRNKKVVMLTGCYSSTNALAMTQRADALNIPLLVSTASDDRITRRHGENIFRLNPPAREYAFGLEHLLQQKLKPKSMAIVYENSPFGTGAAMRMMWFCRENEIDITVIIPYHKERAAADYFDRIIAPLKRNPPQTIYLVSYKQDGVTMVQRLRTAGITAQLLGGAGGFTHPDFIKETRGASDLMMTATLWSAQQPYPLAGRYVRFYKNAHNNEEPDYHGAEAYSALMVAADALRRSKSMRPEDIRDALQKTRISTPFGNVAFTSYDGFERQNRQSTLVLQAINGRYKCVWPSDLAMAQLVLPNPDYLNQKGMKEAGH